MRARSSAARHGCSRFRFRRPRSFIGEIESVVIESSGANSLFGTLPHQHSGTSVLSVDGGSGVTLRSVGGPNSVAEEAAHVVVAFDDNRLIPALFGEFDQNLALIEQRLGVDAAARGNQVTIRGRPEDLNRARLALDILYDRLRKGHELAQGDVDGAIRMAEAAEAQLSLPSLEPGGRLTMAPDIDAAAHGDGANAGSRRLHTGDGTESNWFLEPVRRAPEKPISRLHLRRP